MILTIAVPTTAAMLWGAFLSPKAFVRLHWAVRLTIEALLFCGVGLALYLEGFALLAVSGVSVWALDRLTIWAVRRPSTL